MRVAVLTISDAGARGERQDTSGDAIDRWARERRYDVTARALVPDDSVRIVSALCEWCDRDTAELVLTTGGTGLSPRDVTPEATRAVIERDAPGIAERIRVLSVQRSEEHTSELQSAVHLVCRLLLEKKKRRCRPSTVSGLSSRRLLCLRGPRLPSSC